MFNITGLQAKQIDSRCAYNHRIQHPGSLPEKEHFILVLLDLEKAYDTYWRRYIVNTLAENRIRGNMLHFVRNFMENRLFRVILGESSSERTSIENGMVQGAVMSVTLFLVAMADIIQQVQRPVEMIGYADDCVIYTKDQDMDTAQTNTQTAINNVSTRTRRKGFKISYEKIVAMHICRKKTHNHTNPVLRLKRQQLEKSNSHKILGLTFDRHLTWKTHIDEVRTKTLKR
jgi:hypothetical protein